VRRSREVRAFIVLVTLSICVPIATTRSEEAQKEPAEKPTIAATRVDTPPVIDGHLDDAVWSQAEVGGPLFGYDPPTGEAMNDRTEFRFLYDSQNLYMGIWCFDSEPEKITARLMSRDAYVFSDDYVFLCFDTFRDKRNGYNFVVNPLGARRDALISDNTRLDEDWDTIWSVRTSRDERGWYVELKLPFKSIAFDPESEVWGFNMSRSITRRRERGRWTAARPDVRTYMVAEAGTITGLRGLDQGIGLDVVPYVVGRYDDDRVDSDVDRTGDFGVDARYRLTPNLTASLSYNTDFAETEVDERQVNLTRFPLFFPEKRDFFLEDSGIFNFGGLQRRSSSRTQRTGVRPPEFLPFFSRRIGLDDDGDVVPVLGAAKLTGRVGDWNIGVLDAVLDSHDNLGEKNVFVGRVSRNILEQSSVGLLSTVGDPNSDTENAVLGGDFRYRTNRLLGTNILEAGAFALGSYTEDLDDETDGAFGANVSLPNDFYLAEASFFQIGENFDSALGFVPRTGIRSYGTAAGYQPRPESIDFVRQTSSIYRSQHVTDLDDRLETAIHTFTPLLVSFDSADEIWFQSIYEFDSPAEDFEISDGVVLLEDDYWWLSHSVGVDTASKRMVSAEFIYTFGEFYTGDRDRYLFEAKAFPWKHLGMAAGYTINRVRLAEGDFDTRVTSARMQWNINPDLTWFHLLQYDSVSENVGFNSRIQWELRPGSLLYLVLNQSFLREDRRLDLEQTELTAKLGVTLRF